MKAKAYSKDPKKAVCFSDPVENDCIEKVQRALGRQLSIQGKKILDYGCGVGRWVEYFEKAGFQYHGIDIAEEMIGIAKKLFPKVDFRALDKGEIPYPSASFDIVCSIGVIHHNPYPQQEKILEEILRILRPGGYLLLFEGITKSKTDSSYMFERTRAEWAVFLNRYSLKCQWYRGGRYFVVRDISKKLTHWTKLAKPSHSFRILDRMARIDSVFSPLLGHFLPEKFQTRAAMLFRSVQP